jgi:hypothetical protein
MLPSRSSVLGARYVPDALVGPRIPRSAGSGSALSTAWGGRGSYDCDDWGWQIGEPRRAVVADFAETYVDQNERDYAALQSAVNDGRAEATTDI